MSNLKKNILLALTAVSMIAGSAFGADVPEEISRPDGKPGDMSKPVKVYILAGQSNMVGFGRLSGARPTYPSIYLSADPGIKVGRMPVGPAALLRHGVYQSAAKDAATGAKALIYRGAYDPKANYAAMKPIKETTVPLGTVKAELPGIDGPHTVVVKAFIDVPMSGAHEIHAGFGKSTYAVAELNGKEVYRKEPGKEAVLTKVNLERGKRYPVTVTYMQNVQGESAAFWLEHVELKGRGDLKTVIQEGNFPWFADADGNWTVRQDVTYIDTRLKKDKGGMPLSPTVNGNGRHIGPEIPFGYVLGAYHDAQVLMIESSIGNRALSFDFRPPSSGKTEEEKKNKYCGLEYNLMVEGVHDTLKNLDKIVPGYQGQGYEIAGFVWWQGHKDSGKSKEEYERHLVNLIQDLREEFEAPDMRAVVATVGFGGANLLDGPWKGVWQAQMAVSDAKQHPELADKVVTVDTRDFWRDPGYSPTGTGYHYNHNAETYALTGDALGRAMVELLGGKAEPLRLPPEPEEHPDVAKIYSSEVTGHYNRRGPHYAPEYYREMGQALKPIILEKMIPSFVESAFKPKSRDPLKGIVLGEKPAKTPLDIRNSLDTLMEYYDIAGMSEYGWHIFNPGMRTATWHYFSFDPPEKQPREQSDRYRKVTFPEGMENWFSPEFDPAKAGWKKGKAPFGQIDGKLAPLRPSCDTPYCGCSKKPATLWEKEVLLMRRTFEVPPLKKGHVYRLILGGAGCDRTGEGFAIYVNGKLFKQCDGGFFRHPGVRGAYLYNDMLPEFKGGKVTIAIINFLRYTHFRNKTTYWGPLKEYRGKEVPPNGHVSLWMQEAKLAPEVLEAAGK